MHFSIVSKKSYDKKETLLVPLAADPKVTSRLNDTDRSFIDAYVKDTSFSRKDIALIKIPELDMTVLLCGIGSLTDSLAHAVRSYSDRIESLTFEIEMFSQFSLSDDSLVNSIVSAVLLGADKGRSSRVVKLRSVTINVPDGTVESYRDRFNRSIENITATRNARLMGNMLSSKRSAESASEMMRKGLSKRIRPRVIGLKELKSLRLYGLAALAEYSDEEPSLLVFEHKPEKGKTIVVCGSCLIDPTRTAEERDRDVIGAALVRSLCETYSVYDKDHHIVFLIALARCDSSRAPSAHDIRLASGTSYTVSTIEHLRYVMLADAIYYASRYKPRIIASFAAEGLSHMLGYRIMTYVSNADVLKEALEHAGRFVHERVWELPIISLRQVHGENHTIRLRAARANAAFTNAMSLELSSGGYPWMHLDLSSHIASSRAHGLLSEGATGIGAATMTEYLRRVSGETIRDDETPKTDPKNEPSSPRPVEKD
ncbi:MAG: hypothetical protein ACMXYM_00060 [Candidatus Woesearchaeota archaeon]